MCRRICNFIVATICTWLVVLCLFASAAYAQFTCTEDMQGADDEPGQKDINQFCEDGACESGSGFFIQWNFDDTAWPGNNTGDACALFDSDGDTNADFAVCATLSNGTSTTPPILSGTLCYSCGDTRPDRCTSAVEFDCTSSCVSDLAVAPFTTAKCAGTNCKTTDTEVTCCVKPGEFGGTAELTDVCSFPSMEPNSDPSDCIITATVPPTDECQTAADCADDENVCTTETCDTSANPNVCVPENNTDPCASDGNDCTDDVCNEGVCVSTNDNTNTCGDPANTDCDNPDSCVAGVCQDNLEGPGTTCTSDGNACTDDECNASGVCVSTNDNTNTCGSPTGTDCDNPDSCVAGACQDNLEDPGTTCTSDGNACTDDECNAVGVCVSTNDDTNTCGDPANTDCDNPDSCVAGVCQDNLEQEGTACADETFCDGEEVCSATGTCEDGPDPDCTDEFSCTVDECSTLTDACTNTPDDSACDDTNACTDNVCDPSSNGPALSSTSNGASGCTFPPISCDDANVCTDDSCEPVEIGCVNEFDPQNNVACEGICRTAGFWRTHACGSNGNGLTPGSNCEGKITQNITQQVLNLGGGCVEICGEVVDNTILNSADSALEGMCVSPSGNSKLQLVRQLIAASLNCIVSGFGSHCEDGPDALMEKFFDCNSGCPASSASSNLVKSCIPFFDCYNNGGVLLEGNGFPAGGFCQTGTCLDINDIPVPCNSSDKSRCKAGATCTLIETCHSQPLEDPFDPPAFDFEPPGPAGSSDACNKATGNKCTVIPPGETFCRNNTNDVKLACGTNPLKIEACGQAPPPVCVAP